MPFGLGFFATAGAGGAGSFDLLETQVLGSAVSSVTFSSLSTYASSYQHLQIRFTARSTSGAGSTLYTNFTLNSDTGANYAWHSLRGNGSNVGSFAGTSQNYGRSGLATGSTAASNAFAASVLDILDPFETTKNKTTRFLAGAGEIYLGSSFWNNTAAISSITVSEGYSSNFVTGSRFSLYGSKVA